MSVQIKTLNRGLKEGGNQLLLLADSRSIINFKNKKI